LQDVLFSVPTDVGRIPNPNVNFYIGCQGSESGWSSLGGTIVRYSVFDDAGHGALFDYPAWNSKSFDAVTNVWINTILVVNQRYIWIYIDGEKVDQEEFGFFVGGSTGGGIPAVCHGNIACDQRSGLAVTDHLNADVGTITMQEDLFLGGRMDLQADRHFRGKLASLTVMDRAMTTEEIECVFAANDGLLPSLPECNAMIAEMVLGRNFQLDLSFLGSSDDDSGNRHAVTAFGGDVVVTEDGAKFDGDGDYIQIEDVDYETDGDFTVAFWLTKPAVDDCSGSDDGTSEEYLFSHVKSAVGPSGSWASSEAALTARLNSNVNIYIVCQAGPAPELEAAKSALRCLAQTEASV
jgi:hypothetical protein